MSDWQIRRDRHYDLMATLNAELRGVIEAVGREANAGRISYEHALDRIRDKAAKTQTAIDASWNELLGGAK